MKVLVFTQDAILVSLCFSAYPWARYLRHKGALKVHMLVDNKGSLPLFMRMTTGEVLEVRAVKDCEYGFSSLTPDRILIVDRAYMTIRGSILWSSKASYSLYG